MQEQAVNMVKSATINHVNGNYGLHVLQKNISLFDIFLRMPLHVPRNNTGAKDIIYM